jgi:hypothetical protein
VGVVFSLSATLAFAQSSSFRHATPGVANALIDEGILDADNLGLKGVLPTSLDFDNRPLGADDWDGVPVYSSLSPKIPHRLKASGSGVSA